MRSYEGGTRKHAAALEWENFSALTERQQLSWLRRVAHNKLVDRYRSAVHLPAVSLLNKREATARKLCSRTIALLRTIYEQQ